MDKSLVETLKRSAVYREYESAFRGAVGLPLAFTPVETWGLPLREDAAESPFCRVMAGRNKTCAACLEIQAKLTREAAGGVASERCFSGMRDSAVPVKLGDRLVGFLRTGQVFLKPPTEEDFQDALARLIEWGVTVDPDELRAAYFASKVLTPAQHQSILRLLKLFADHLGSLSNQILVAEETAENPQIARAREFIAENMAEDISLADCARASHMSTFYFCKMFKKATGLSFTEYLSRLRVEEACARLLDPHVRISEVAFEVGFQSLSQFNRAFKKIAGQSPTEYRRRLPATLASRPFDTDAREGVVSRFKFGARGPHINGRRSAAAG